MEYNKIDHIYCSEICPIGKSKKEEFLKYNNSAIDAAFDMLCFVSGCSKTCKRQEEMSDANPET